MFPAELSVISISKKSVSVCKIEKKKKVNLQIVVTVLNLSKVLLLYSAIFKHKGTPFVYF